MARRFPVTISRNDGRADRAFRRWTIYAGNQVLFDIEATAVPGYPARVVVLQAKGGKLPGIVRARASSREA